MLAMKFGSACFHWKHFNLFKSLFILGWCYLENFKIVSMANSFQDIYFVPLPNYRSANNDSNSFHCQNHYQLKCHKHSQPSHGTVASGYYNCSIEKMLTTHRTVQHWCRWNHALLVAVHAWGLTKQNDCHFISFSAC